jgi:hypothetical protein
MRLYKCVATVKKYDHCPKAYTGPKTLHAQCVGCSSLWRTADVKKLKSGRKGQKKDRTSPV